MRRKKMAVGAATFAVAALSLAGCGSGSGSSGQSGSADGKKTTITWDMWASGEDDIQWVKDTLAIAQNENPDIEVKSQTANWGDYYTKLTTNMASGNLACITSMNSGQLPTFRAALSPLTEEDLAIAGIDPADYAEGTFEMMTYNDELLVIPYDIAAMLVYYNEDMFEETGTPLPTNEWTFDDFVTTAKGVTTPEHFGFGLSLGDFQWQALPIALSGLQMVNEDGQLDATNPDWVKAATWYSDLATKEKVASPVPSASDTGWGEAEFGAGNTAMAVDGTWNASGYFEKDFTAGAVRLPTGPNGTSGEVLGSGFGIAASCEGADREAALKVLGSLLGKEAQELLASSGRSYPSYVAAQDLYIGSFDTEIGEKLRVAFDAGFKNVTGQRTTENWAQIGNYLTPNLIPVYTGQESMESVMTNVQSQFGQ